MPVLLVGTRSLRQDVLARCAPMQAAGSDITQMRPCDRASQAGKDMTL